MNTRGLSIQLSPVLLLAIVSTLMGTAHAANFHPADAQVGHIVQPTADVEREFVNETFDVLWSRRSVGPSPREELDPDRFRDQVRQVSGREDNFSLVASLPRGLTNIWEGDMDHDGAKELWYGQDQLGPVQVWEVTGDNTFALVHETGPPTSYSWFIGIGDTDGDGLEEIIWKAGYYADPYLVFYEQPDPYTFPSAPTAEHHTGVVNTHFTHLRVFDMDADGLREVICSHQGTSSRSVAVYESIGDDTYQEVYGGNYGPNYAVSGCVGVGDFDGDGYMEIAAPEVGDQVYIHVVECREGNNYFETWTSDVLPDDNGYWVTEGGDLDRDGKDDFVALTGSGGFGQPVCWTVWMFESTEDNAYQVVWTYELNTSGAIHAGVISGDANGDGYSDLLFQVPDRSILFTGVADNTLEIIWEHEGTVREQGRKRLITSDLDLDGKPEIVWYTDSNLVVYEYVPECFGDLDGDGDVDLADLAILLANYGTTSGAIYEDGDLDGDGDVDLADLAALLAVYGTTCP